eukprot:COSAG02_NODE_23750_length_709_cov_1.239344_1_plen_52_part_01
MRLGAGFLAHGHLRRCSVGHQLCGRDQHAERQPSPSVEVASAEKDADDGAMT